MAKKNKNTDKSTFIKSITNPSGIWSWVKLFWIFLVPVFITINLYKGYKIKQQEYEIVQLTDTIESYSKKIENLTENNKILNNNLAATSAQLNNLQIQTNNLSQKLLLTSTQYSSYKTNINDNLDELKSDLYRLNVQINSLQNNLLGTQRQGRDQ